VTDLKDILQAVECEQQSPRVTSSIMQQLKNIPKASQPLGDFHAGVIVRHTLQ
jgi:hypothetical protein